MHHHRRRHPSRDVTDDALGPTVKFVTYDEAFLRKTVIAILQSSYEYDLASVNDPVAIANGLLSVAPSTLALDGDKGLLLFGPLRPGEDSAVHVHLWSPVYFRRSALARSTLAWGMKNWDLHRVYAVIPARNRLACRYVENLGFNEEGVLKEHFRYTGGRDDGRLFALLREELS